MELATAIFILAGLALIVKIKFFEKSKYCKKCNTVTNTYKDKSGNEFCEKCGKVTQVK